jgi:RNA polymerase sigma-70 factor, ECF subfamily
MAAQPSHMSPTVRLRKLRARDAGTWEELVSRLHVRVFNLLLRLTGDREAAADLTQEAFVAAYGSVHGFRGSATPETWVCGIALNCLRNRQRQSGAQGPEGELPDDLADPAPTVEQIAELRERGEMLRGAVEQLPEPYRTTVALHYFADIPSVEIAAREGVDAGTVRWRLHKALKRLWALLEPELRKEATT